MLTSQYYAVQEWVVGILCTLLLLNNISMQLIGAVYVMSHYAAHQDRNLHAPLTLFSKPELGNTTVGPLNCSCQRCRKDFLMVCGGAGAVFGTYRVGVPQTVNMGGMCPWCWCPPSSYAYGCASHSSVWVNVDQM